MASRSVCMSRSTLAISSAQRFSSCVSRAWFLTDFLYFILCSSVAQKSVATVRIWISHEGRNAAAPLVNLTFM